MPEDFPEAEIMCENSPPLPTVFSLPHKLLLSYYLCIHKPKLLFKHFLTPTLKRSSKGQNQYMQ